MRAKNNRLRNGLINILLFLGSIIFIIGILEVVIRLLWKDNFDKWLVGPSYNEGKLKEIYYEPNSFYRRLEMTYDPAKVNILGTGDSMTFGTGVYNIDDLYLSKLKNKLDSIYPTQINNLAKGGYDVSSVFIVIRNYYNSLKPDIVFYGICLNDIITPELQYSIDKQNESPNKLLNWLESNFYLFFDISYRISRINESLEGISYGNIIIRLFKDKGSEWKIFTDTIVSMKQFCEERNVRLILAIIPFLVDFKNYPFLEVHRQMKQFCDNNNINCIDLLSVFHGYNGRHFWVNPYDSHPNEQGHMLIAEGIYPEVKAEVEKISKNLKRPFHTEKQTIQITGETNLAYTSDEYFRLVHYKILQNPNNPNNHYELGLGYFKIGKLDSALLSFKKALQLKPDYIDGIKKIALIYFESEKYNEAINMYLSIQKLQQLEKEELLNLGSAYFYTSQYRNAVQVYKNAIETYPKIGYFRGNLVFILMKLQNYDDAWKYLREAEKEGFKMNPQIINELKTKAPPDSK